MRILMDSGRALRVSDWFRVLLFLLVFGAGSGFAVAQTSPTREITRIAGDLYRFRNNFHYSVFLVTPAGIVATDPINPDAARWLKAELQNRFNRPIRYLVYSHDHADHIAGGEILSEGAVVVAHERAKAHIRDEKRPTALPQIVFSERMTIELGGKTVELSYLGRNHSDNSIVMRFPEERALFAVDFVAVKTLPYRNFPNGYIDEWVESLKRLEALDFEILVPGHGPLGGKNDVRLYRRYIETLRGEVMQHVRAGKSLDEIKQLVTMEGYRDWARYYEWLPLNIEGMFRHIQLYRRPN